MQRARRPCLLWCFGRKSRNSSDDGQTQSPALASGQSGSPGPGDVSSGPANPGALAATAGVTGPSAAELAAVREESPTGQHLPSQIGQGVAVLTQNDSLRTGSHRRVAGEVITSQLDEQLRQASLPHAASQIAALSPQQSYHSRWQGVKDLDPRIRIPFSEITLHKIIGKGTFKTVYRGSWNNTHVAVVAMRRGGLVTEARLLQSLSTHPNLVQLYRWSTDEAGNEYLVMELLHLGSLDAVLRSIGRQLLTQTKMTVVEQVVSACSELAREGLVHGDLSARNLLVKSLEPPHIKLADFGLSRPAFPSSALAAGSVAFGAGDAAGAAFGAVGSDALYAAPGAGAPALASPTALSHEMHSRTALPHKEEIVPARWAAPELLAGGPPSEAGDVWSFGVTCWEIFANGAEPYANLSNGQILSALRAGYRLDRPRGCPLELWDLVQQCWADDPKDRPSFNTIAATLRGWREAYVRKRTAVGPTVAAAGPSTSTAVATSVGAAAAAAQPPAFTLFSIPAAPTLGRSGGGVPVAMVAPDGASSSTCGSSRIWRAVPSTGGMSSGAHEPRRYRPGPTSRDYRSPMLPLGSSAFGQRASGSGGFGPPPAQAAQPGAFSTHMSFDINEPSITPAYTSGSSIGVASPPGLSRELLDAVGVISGGGRVARAGTGGAAASSSPRQPPQSDLAGARPKGARLPFAGASTVSSAAVVSGRGRGALTSGTTAADGAAVEDSGMQGPGAAQRAYVPDTGSDSVRTPTTASNSSVNANSGNQRSSAGARSSGSFLDVRMERPHRLCRSATSLAEIGLGVLQPREAVPVVPGAAAPVSVGGVPAGTNVAALGDVAASALALRQTIGFVSISSGRIPSTLLGDRHGSAGGASAVSGGAVSSSAGSGPLQHQHLHQQPSSQQPQAYSGGAAGGGQHTSPAQAAEKVFYKRQLAAPGARAAGPSTSQGQRAQAGTSAGAFPFCQPVSAGPNVPSVAAARAESPYIRINDLAASQMPPPGAWAAGMRHASMGAATGSLPAGTHVGRPLEPLPYSMVSAIDVSLSRQAAAAARLQNPLPAPSQPFPFAVDDLSLRGMVKVPASIVRHASGPSGSGTAPENADAQPATIDSSTGVMMRSMTLALPSSIMVMPSYRASEACLMTRESVSGGTSAHHIGVSTTSQASQNLSGDPESSGGPSGSPVPLAQAARTPPRPVALLGLRPVATCPVVPVTTIDEEETGSAMEVEGTVILRVEETNVQQMHAFRASQDTQASGTILSTRTSGAMESPFTRAEAGRPRRSRGGSTSIPVALDLQPHHRGASGGVLAAAAPPPSPRAPQPQPHQHLNPLLQAHQRLTRTRRGSNGSRASGSIRCGPTAADHMSPHMSPHGSGPVSPKGSGPVSGASSRGVGGYCGVPARLLRTEPVLDMSGSPAAAISPTASVRSAHGACSLQSTWSGRSVVAALAAVYLGRVQGGGVAADQHGSHMGLLEPLEGAAAAAPAPARAATSLAATAAGADPAGATTSVRRGTLTGPSGPLPEVTAQQVAYGGRDVAPLVAVKGPQGLSPRRTQTPDSLDMLQTRQMMAVLQELPESSSDGLVHATLAAQAIVDPADHRPVLVARAFEEYEADTYMAYAETSRGGPRELTHGSVQMQHPHHLILAPTWEVPEGQAGMSREQGQYGSAAYRQSRESPEGAPGAETAAALGGAPGAPDAAVAPHLVPTQDEVVAERQAIFDYLQARQLQQLQQDRDE